MAKKTRKTGAVGKKNAAKKTAKKAVTRKKTVAKKVAPTKKAKKIAKKATVSTTAMSSTLALGPTNAVQSAVFTCVNNYLNTNRPGWNADGAGNDKALSDLHLPVPLFLDSVRRCLEQSVHYTFDVTAVAAKILGGNVSKAKQEIVLAAKHV